MPRRRPSSQSRRVAVCVDKSRAYGRGVLRGIADYVETHRRWWLYLDPRASGNYRADWLRGWDGDGVIAFIEDEAIAAALRDRRLPAVEVFGHRLDLGLPHVGNDEEAFGRAAASHLLERHFKHFAFAGVEGALWSARREAGFAGVLEEHGFNAHRFVTVADDGAALTIWEKNQRALRRWLGTLPKPCGLMACSDRHALRVLNACRSGEISVPEQLAVIGVDNDEETCRLANPPLTSVIDDARRIGWAAAAMLDDLMARKKLRNPRVLLPPLGIATRRSTDVTAVEDPIVARACRLISERACEGLNVEQLTVALGLSKTAFYNRFRKALGRLPHHEILRVRLDRAQSMLRQTTLPVEEIAAACGFHHPEYLTVSFKRELGTTPARYRKSARSKTPV